jgi:hypothetical protein
MRARTIAVLAVLFLVVGVRPAAADRPIVFQRDGTFFYSIHAELRAQAGASAESSDSTEAPKLVAIAGGASLAGLAAYFIASSGGNNPQPGLPGYPNAPGGVVIPPQEQSTPALPNQPYDPGGPGGTNGTNDPFTGPVTTTPEPVSMTLLATGLAGVGAARLRRRRGG